MRFGLLSLVAMCGVAFASRDAWATASYPPAIESHLGLGYTPPCTICHQSAAGGAGSATKPFANSMKAKGLAGGGDTTGLNAALDALKAAKTDSDGDTVADIDELVSGNDPNVKDKGKAGSLGGDQPAYGCGNAQIASGPVGGDRWAWLLGALAAAAVGRASTRRRRR